MLFSAEIKRLVNILTVNGPIKAGLEFDLFDNMDKIFNVNDYPIYMDLKKCDFMNSAALGVILNYDRQCDAVNREFVIFEPSKDIVKLIETVGVSKVLEIVNRDCGEYVEEHK